MIPLRDFVPKLNSRSGTTAWVNSRRGDSIRHDILWWCHENKCWAMRGNRTELAAAQKSPRCRVNTPWELLELRNGLFPMFSSTLPLDQSTGKKSLCYCKIRFQETHRFYNLSFYRVLVWAKGQNDYKSIRFKVWQTPIPCLLLLLFLASFLFFYVAIFNNGWTTLKRKHDRCKPVLRCLNLMVPLGLMITVSKDT